MSDKSPLSSRLREQLARNRLLYDILHDEATQAHHDHVRARCREEMKAIAKRRTQWRGLAAAMLVCACLVAVTIFSERTTSKTTTTDVTAKPDAPNNKSHHSLISIHHTSTYAKQHTLVTVISAPSYIDVAHSPGTSRTVVTSTPTAAITTASLEIVRSRDLRGGFFPENNAPNALVYAHVDLSASAYQRLATNELPIQVSILSDHELLAMPGVAALRHVAPGQARISFMRNLPQSIQVIAP